MLKVIPLVCSVNENDVNAILYEWFTGLGDDGYDRIEISLLPEKNLRYMADTGWITEEYLGEPLAAVLSRFKELPDIDRANAPVSFDHLNNSDHSNEKFYQDMDYEDNRYRLLGLFRLWNAIRILLVSSVSLFSCDSSDDKELSGISVDIPLCGGSVGGMFVDGGLLEGVFVLLPQAVKAKTIKDGKIIVINFFI